MRQIWIIFIFFILPLLGSAQMPDSLIIPLLTKNINKKETKPKSPRRIGPTSFPLKIMFMDSGNMKSCFSGLYEIIDSTIVSELYKKTSSDSIPIKWEIKDDKNYIVTDSTPNYGSFRKYKFTFPIFDKSLRYCIIGYSYYCGRECGHSEVFLMERKKNKWVKKFKLMESYS